MGDALSDWGTNWGTWTSVPLNDSTLTHVSAGQASGAGGARTHDPRIMSPLL